MGKELIKQENNLIEILHNKGMTNDMVADKIIEMLDWKDEYVDKNGNCHFRKDGQLRLKAIELWMKLQQGPRQTNNNHLHVGEGVLDKLLGQGKSNKGKGSK